MVELNWYPRGSRFGGRYVAGDAVEHLDFTLGAVPVSILEAAWRRLLRHGARSTALRPATTQGWQASVLDPNGNWITVGRRPTAAERRAMRGR